ncbi:NAD(P)-dependent alcohol dehydrogenase [Pseudonocardia broussonetiae]|nr:NAD(P)-dependent alcohol dehydrogenase [Pseudonocardia broussonetiae]
MTDQATATATATASMTAIVQDEYGTEPEGVLRLATVARPSIRDNEVRVRVHAASVDRGTWHVMAGLPYPIRAAGFGLPRPKHLNPGRSLSGTIDAVGTGVSGFEPGDEVFGIGAGSFAEYVGVRTDTLAAEPSNLSFEEAAAVPVSALTALQAVRDHGRVQTGEMVLIIGASGGVGSFAVQIAKAYGAEVTGVCGTAAATSVRGAGADHVIDHTRADPTGGSHRYDVILDIAGNRRLSRLRRALTPTGRLVIVGGETDGRWLGGTGRQLRALLLSPFVSQTLGTFVTSENADDLAVLRGLIESGRIAPVIDRTYPLGEVPTAVRHLVEGHPQGKIVIAVWAPGRD